MADAALAAVSSVLNNAAPVKADKAGPAPVTPIRTTGNAGPRIPPRSAPPVMRSDTLTPPRHSTGPMLLVRLDRPVEGIPIKAHTLLRGMDGSVITPSKRRLEYRWFRSRERQTCAAADCAAKSPEGVRAMWSPATIQCLSTLRRFCSGRCLASGLAEEKRRLGGKIAPRHASVRGPEHEDDDEDERLLWSVVPFREDLRSPSPEVWTEVAVTSDKVYTPTSEDVGHVLVVKCTAKTPSADIVASFTSEPTEVVIPSPQTPPPRTLLTAPDANMMVLLQPQFRVVSYNILAESYATMKMYPYCPVWALSWNYRKVLIMRELIGYNADVICLQEVQANHYDAYIYPMLREAGYEGLFKCKTREGTTGPGKVDGCATFFRTSRFRIMNAYDVEYNALAMSAVNSGEYADPNLDGRSQKKRSDKILQRLMRGNVAQITMVELLSPPMKTARMVCIANTHIFWDPDYPDVKLWQTNQLIRELQSSIGPGTPIILSGDFNSMPGSTVVQLLRDERVDPGNPEFASDALGLFPMPEMLSHRLNFESAYESVAGAEPLYTNYTGHYKGVLDYVWYSREHLAAVSVLKVHDADVLRGPEDAALPNSQNPSDHIATIVDFNLLRYPRRRNDGY